MTVFRCRCGVMFERDEGRYYPHCGVTCQHVCCQAHPGRSHLHFASAEHCPRCALTRLGDRLLHRQQPKEKGQ